jgi:hypothetical protein
VFHCHLNANARAKASRSKGEWLNYGEKHQSRFVKWATPVTEPRELQHLFEERWGRMNARESARFLGNHNVEEICRYRQEWIREAVLQHSDLNVIHSALVLRHSEEVQRLEQAAEVYRTVLARSPRPALSKLEKEARARAIADRERLRQRKEQAIREKKLAERVRRDRETAEAAAAMAKNIDVSDQLVDPESAHCAPNQRLSRHRLAPAAEWHTGRTGRVVAPSGIA